MGISTIGVISKEVSGKEVFDIVVSVFDKEARLYEGSNFVTGRPIADIVFNNNGQKRGLSYSITSGQVPGTDYDRQPHGTLTLGCWGNSKEIIADIVKHFGGYVDENDCDEGGYIYVPKDTEYLYSNYVRDRDLVEAVLDKELSRGEKLLVADQIMKHRRQLRDMFNHNLSEGEK